MNALLGMRTPPRTAFTCMKRRSRARRRVHLESAQRVPTRGPSTPRTIQGRGLRQLTQLPPTCWRSIQGRGRQHATIPGTVTVHRRERQPPPYYRLPPHSPVTVANTGRAGRIQPNPDLLLVPHDDAVRDQGGRGTHRTTGAQELDLGPALTTTGTQTCHPRCGREGPHLPGPRHRRRPSTRTQGPAHRWRPARRGPAHQHTTHWRRPGG